MTLNERLDELLRKQAPEIERAFRAAIQDITDKAILQQIIDAVERNDLDAAIRALGYNEAVFNEFVMALQSAFQAGGVLVMSDFPKYVTDASGVKIALRFNMRDPRAEQWLKDQSSQLITAIEDDMRQAVRNTLQAGLADGRNPRNVALDIIGRLDLATKQRVGGVIGLGQREEFWSRSARQKLTTLDPAYFTMELRDKRFDRTVATAIEQGKPLPDEIVDKLMMRYRANALRHRGETIGRTEMIQSLNRSEYLATKQAVEAGNVRASAVQRIWDSAGDNRVRPSHKALDGQRVGLDEPFISPVTGAKMMHPGDTSLGAGGNDIVACRCRVKTVVDWLAGVS